MTGWIRLIYFAVKFKYCFSCLKDTCFVKICRYLLHYFMFTEVWGSAAFRVWRKRETLMTFVKHAWGYMQAWARWSSHRRHTHTHTHECTQRWGSRTLSVLQTHSHQWAAARYARHFLHVSVFTCVFPRQAVFIMSYRQPARWCIAGRIPFEQGHRMTPCRSVMDGIYSCQRSSLGKERLTKTLTFRPVKMTLFLKLQSGAPSNRPECGLSRWRKYSL